MRKARLNRVDEDDICDIQPREWVVLDDVRRRWQGAIREHRDTLGANRPKVEPDGARAGAAIEGDEERAVLGVIDAIQGVVRVEQQGIDTAIRILDGKVAGFSRVGKGFVTCGDGSV